VPLLRGSPVVSWSHLDVFQILPEHGGRPQATALVQVGRSLRVLSTRVCSARLRGNPPSHSADTIPPFNRCCLSCEVKCGYVDVSFSHDMRYFLLDCKGECRRPPGGSVFVTVDSERFAPPVLLRVFWGEWGGSGTELVLRVGLRVLDISR